MIGLGTLPGTTGSRAFGISSDGTAVVGYSELRNSNIAFRWTQSGGMARLDFLPGGAHNAAFGVSADGTVVVGHSSGSSGNQAVRWVSTKRK